MEVIMDNWIHLQIISSVEVLPDDDPAYTLEEIKRREKSRKKLERDS